MSTDFVVDPIDRSASRLTAGDRARVAGALRETFDMWERNSAGGRLVVGPLEVEALYRRSRSCLGCVDADFRDAELGELDDIVARFVYGRRGYCMGSVVEAFRHELGEVGR